MLSQDSDSYFSAANKQVRRQQQQGLSLLELTLVVAILGIIAVVAIPNYSSTDLTKLDLAASQVAEAIRFARTEALRTNEVHGVLVDSDQSESLGKDLTVFKVDPAGSPFGLDHILYHPLSKQLYDLWLMEATLTRGVAVSPAMKPFQYYGAGANVNYLHFSGSGLPIYLDNGTPRRLTQGDIQINYGAHLRIVSVAPITGRVTIQ